MLLSGGNINMSKFYSRSKPGFYSHEAHGKEGVPADAVEITDEEWQALLDAQARGQRIVTGVHGRPIVVDHKPTAADLLAQRDRALSESDWLVARHRDEIEINPTSTTLTQGQYAALQMWRSQLRNISNKEGFPDITIPTRPV